ncbi:Gmad2 immunoglobulin-like domain-containing protein [Cytobacillus suaedae]|nr:Gmad2 immunoglobulin-like domain-containing protein [Cytobacillus suaedae]
MIKLLTMFMVALAFLSGCNNDQNPPPEQTQETENNQATDTTDEETTEEHGAHNEAFHVESPQPGDSVEYTFTVKGEAQVYEGSFAYRLVADDGEELVREYVQVNQEDQEGKGLWRSFEFTVYLDDHTTPSATLYLYEESEKDGTVTNELAIPITFIPSEE